MRNWFIEQMAMYSAYHTDRRNQATHHIGVPMIVFSLLLLTWNVEIVSIASVSINLASLLMTTLLLFYVYCLPLVGIFAILLYGSLLFLTEAILTVPQNDPFQLFGVFFVTGWIIQFIGHGFEGRRPALFDNILQIFMAPAFLMAELLFLAGREQALRLDLEARMVRYLPNAKEEHS